MFIWAINMKWTKKILEFIAIFIAAVWFFYNTIRGSLGQTQKYILQDFRLSNQALLVQVNVQTKKTFF